MITRFARALALGIALLPAGAHCAGAPAATRVVPVAVTTNHSLARPAPTPHTNRLAREKSPYLLQHAGNPVDWFPWGEEAFARARAENKPIFLSIGYSTCHWCHVMERESFENEAVARDLRENFISIKIDREERPDVDRIYMTFVQATTGSGGWPLTVFLTPDLRPFYGGTYFPPEERFNRPGFRQLLAHIARNWRERSPEIRGTATNIFQQLESLAARPAGKGPMLSPEVLRRALPELKQGFDSKHGGWGRAPKFPTPGLPALLFRLGHRLSDPAAHAQVFLTCDRMAAGGIYDQLGGGFARYSVDERWLVPHFEKMLYDNAQLACLYLDAYRISGASRHAAIVRDIIAYVQRDMAHPEGGFYSAEDADSEGKEGKFYCWTQAELTALLPPAELAVVSRHFGITAQGNFVDHSDPHPLPGQNVLSIVDPALSAAETALLASARNRMQKVRNQRVRPHRDDKVLTSWNGLMLSALAQAGAVLDEPGYRRAAERNLAFLQHRLWDPQSRTLYHRWRDGERDTVQLLEAYSFLLVGVLDLYETTLDPRQLEFAIALAEGMISRFHDREQGGFWGSPAGATDLPLRLKEDHDGAEPSGNSLAVQGLLRLAAITERSDFAQAAEQTLGWCRERLENQPHAVTRLLAAVDFALGEPRRIVVVGPSDAPKTRALLRAIHQVYDPNRVIMGTTGPVEEFARTLPLKGGEPTAYICIGTSCQPPTNDPAELSRLLRGSPTELGPNPAGSPPARSGGESPRPLPPGR